MLSHRLPTCALFVGCLAATVSSQTITPLVVEGDAVPGVGDVTTIDSIAVNDAGEWLVEADTNFADTTQDGVVLKNGVLFAREGEALVAPAGTSIGSFDSVQMNTAGDLGWNLFLDGAGTGTDSGFFWNKTLLFQEGSSPPIAGLSPGSPFQGFFESKTNDSGTSLLLATIDEPTLTSSVDQVFVLVTGTDPGSLTLTAVAKEGDILAGQTEMVEDFNTGPHDFAFSNAGHIMFFADLTGPTATDGTVYLDGVLLAQEGGASPVAGRSWSSLSLAKMDVNDAGEYVYSGSLDGDSSTNSLIVKNGAKFRQEGDTLPAIAPFVFTSFGSGPIWISNLGDVLWYGDWDDPDTGRDTGLFLNDELLIQEGVTQVNGLTVTTVRGVQDGYHLSESGRFAIVEVELTGGLQTALLVDFGFGAVAAMSDCTGPAATLTWTAGAPLVGGSFDLTLDNPPGANVFPFLGIATQPVAGFPPCGVVVPGIGELLIDFLPPNPIVVLSPGATGGGPTVFTIPLPNDPNLGGADFYAQGLYVDLIGATAEPFRPSNGVSILVGV